MTRYNDEITMDKTNLTVKFTHDDAPNSCNFLKLDVEEHPQLRKSDVEPLGLRLMECVDKYIEENRTIQIEEHSSSYHVMNGSDCWAKVWYNGRASSQIATKEGARSVAKRLVELLEDTSQIKGMPRIKHIISHEYNCDIVNRQGKLARFVKTSDAEKWLEKEGLDKYNQKIKSQCGRMILCKAHSNANTIDIFSKCDGDIDLHRDILYDLRKYIHENILEA